MGDAGDGEAGCSYVFSYENTIKASSRYMLFLMTEVTTWQNNDDNVIVQTRASPEPESLITLAESTVKSIRHHQIKDFRN